MAGFHDTPCAYRTEDKRCNFKEPYLSGKVGALPHCYGRDTCPKLIAENRATSRIDTRHRQLLGAIVDLGNRVNALRLAHEETNKILQCGNGVQALERLSNVVEKGLEDMARNLTYVGK